MAVYSIIETLTPEPREREKAPIEAMTPEERQEERDHDWANSISW